MRGVKRSGRQAVKADHKLQHKARRVLARTGEAAVRQGRALYKEAKPHLRRASQEVKHEVKKELYKAAGEIKEGAKDALISQARHRIGLGKEAVIKKRGALGTAANIGTQMAITAAMAYMGSP